MRHGQLGGGAVVAGDERRLDPGHVPRDEHDGKLARHQLPVPVVVGRGIRVQPGHEDDAVDLPVEQHLDVLVLGDAARVTVHSTEVYPDWASTDSMTCANAGKMGLSSSGTTRPTRPALRLRSRAGRS